ncbi:hypothetical protein LCGC14_1440390 [marine sediment metagenome]|uniref:Uncharacterized protein n=1 Tax=marine sediment metagenome TaxID=412755 RepID=A0A0F9JLF9_9ZZZZ
MIFAPFVYFIADANDWVEGTTTAGNQNGSSCWYQAKLNVQDWAGSQGCGTSGTDYDANVSPPTMACGPNGWHTFTLDPAWPPLWRDGIRATNGMLMRQVGGTSNTWIYSTENASLNPYFEVDWEPASTTQSFFFMGGF